MQRTWMISTGALLIGPVHKCCTRETKAKHKQLLGKLYTLANRSQTQAATVALQLESSSNSTPAAGHEPGCAQTRHLRISKAVAIYSYTA